MSKIYVDEIAPKTSGGIVAATEYVRQNAVPAFRVYNISSGSASFKTGHITFTNIEFNQGEHWDNTNSVFVVPVDGVYFFSAGSLLCNSDDSNPLGAADSGTATIEKSTDGGTTFGSAGNRENRLAVGYGYVAGSAHHPNGAMSATAYLNKNDQVRLWTSEGFYYDGTPFNFFSGHLIG